MLNAHVKGVNTSLISLISLKIVAPKLEDWDTPDVGIKQQDWNP